MSFIKYIGAALLLVGAYIFISRYKRYLTLRVEESESFLRLVEHLRAEISCRLTPLGELLCLYTDEALERVGFLPFVREGVGVNEAYSRCERGLSVGREGQEILRRLFAELGRRYKAETLATLDRAREELGAYTARLESELSDDVKLAGAMAFGAAVGLSLLLL